MVDIYSPEMPEGTDGGLAMVIPSDNLPIIGRVRIKGARIIQ
jgi:hypothetical protein